MEERKKKNILLFLVAKEVFIFPTISHINFYITLNNPHGSYVIQGLWRELCTNNCDTFPMRYWIIDNSYSMTQTDGHLILQNSDSSGDIVRTVGCSRYDEIKECVNFHAELSSLISAPTEFRVSGQIIDSPVLSKERIYCMVCDHKN